MNVRYRVELSQAERVELTAMLSKGKRAARKFKRAQILLAADAGCSDEEIARTVAVGGSTIYRTRRRFVEGQSGTGAERGAPPRSGAQALRQGRSLAGGDGLRKPSRGARPLATGTVGRRHDQAHRAREPVRRDGAPALGRKTVLSPGAGYVVHSPGRRRICRPHGRRARPLCRGARSQAAGGLPGSADWRGTPADSGPAGSA
jgi:winged helix-turn helix protein